MVTVLVISIHRCHWATVTIWPPYANQVKVPFFKRINMVLKVAKTVARINNAYS